MNGDSWGRAVEKLPVKQRLAIALIATIIPLGRNATAGMITFGFGGIISQISDPQGQLGQDVLVGDTFSGTYGFYPSTPDQDLNPAVGRYLTAVPFALSIRSFSISSNGLGRFTIYDAPASGSGADSYSLTSEYPPFEPPALNKVSFEISLVSDHTHALASDQLPSQPPDINNFASRSIQVVVRPGGLTYPIFTLDGTIDAITLIPEPASFNLIALGVVVLSVRTGRQQRAYYT